jgi:hypothetical protein
MPHWVFHGMTDADATAVVAYLRSLPPIRNALPERQPLPPEHEASEPFHLDHAALPDITLRGDHPDRVAADRGRYLATSVAFCVLCHSPPGPDARTPIEVTRAFAGGRPVRPERLGLPDRQVLPEITTRNLTPHELALGPWTPAQIADTLRVGVTRDGLPVCDPMPSTEGGAFQGMHEQDALDIGHYLLSIPPIDSGVIEPCCATCHGDDADGGT